MKFLELWFLWLLLVKARLDGLGASLQKCFSYCCLHMVNVRGFWINIVANMFDDIIPYWLCLFFFRLHTTANDIVAGLHWFFVQFVVLVCGGTSGWGPVMASWTASVLTKWNLASSGEAGEAWNFDDFQVDLCKHDVNMYKELVQNKEMEGIQWCWWCYVFFLSCSKNGNQNRMPT